MVEHPDMLLSFAAVIDSLGVTILGIFGLRVIEKILREMKRRQPAYVPIVRRGTGAPPLRRNPSR